MSDLNSSVRDEQISNTQGVTDNTDPVAPLAEEQAETEPAESDLPEDETQEYKELFKDVDQEENFNLSVLSKEELIALLSDLLQNRSVETIVNDVENIKINYYKKHKAEIERKRKAFIEQGGALEDFKVEDDPYENEIKDLLGVLKD